MRLFNKLVIFSLSVVVVLSGINVYAAPEDVWYSDVMETANKIGIINADEQPEETISNADFIKLAVNFIEDKNDIVAGCRELLFHFFFFRILRNALISLGVNGDASSSVCWLSISSSETPASSADSAT